MTPNELTLFFAWSLLRSLDKTRRKRLEYEKNKAGYLRRAKEWTEKNPDANTKATREYSLNNSESRAAYNREYQKRESVKKIKAARRRTPGFRIKNNSRSRCREAVDLNFKLSRRLRGRIWWAIKRNGGRKLGRTETLVGCGIPALISHLEKNFQPGMTWENYGKEWHIDHRKPCVTFDLTLLEQQKGCFHYSNLQPLWKFDNLSKGGRYAS